MVQKRGMAWVFVALAACGWGADDVVLVQAAPEEQPVEPPEPPPEPDAFGVLFEADGMRVDRVPWTWQDRKGSAWRVRLPRTASLQVQPSENVVALSTLAPNDVGPWALLNGGFYDEGAMGLVRSNGVTHTKWSKGGGSGIVYDTPEGIKIVNKVIAFPTKAPNALQSIDRLVDKGTSLVEAREEPKIAARAAVAIAKDHVWLVLLAEDSSIELGDGGEIRVLRPYDRGMSLAAFADWLVTELGATEALNMDGGISTNLLARAGEHELRIRGVGGTINGVLMRP